MPNLAGVYLGPYLLVEQIGTGGMASVYLGYQANLDRLVAVKILLDQFAGDAKFAHRFEQEVRLITRLEHRGIVPLYDAGTIDGKVYLVMRYMRAGTLRDLIARGPLGLADAARILGEVAAAVDHAHEQGVVHRDIKPGNILIDKDGASYLTDFGLAKSLEAAGDMTHTGEILGTPAYMAPEQILGRDVTHLSDVYSLSVMLYEMVTGRQPYQGDTSLIVAMKHVQEPLPLPSTTNPDLPAVVEAVIIKGLSKEAAARPSSAGALARAFEAAVASAGPIAPAQLPALAQQIVASKTIDHVTPRMRRHISGIRRSRQLRRAARWAPLAAGLALIIVLATGWLIAAADASRGRAAADQTATTVGALLNQLAIAQTLAADGNGLQVEPTLQYIQTQVAGLMAGAFAAPAAATYTPVSTSTAAPQATATVAIATPTELLPRTAPASATTHAGTNSTATPGAPAPSAPPPSTSTPPAPPPSTSTPPAVSTATPVTPTATQIIEPSATSTSLPSTATSQPSDTPAPTDTRRPPGPPPSHTPKPSNTPKP